MLRSGDAPLTSAAIIAALGYTPASAGAVVMATGSAASPGMFFVGDSNTGFWSPGADILAFTVGGHQAGYLSNNNTVIGYDSLPVDGGAGNNTVLGADAMINPLYTGRANTALGVLAGASLSSGINNLLVGIYAGRFLTSGNFHTFVGPYAGMGAVGTPLTGDQNTGVGEAAMLAIAGSASRNTSVGMNSLFSMTQANDNTALGMNAGYNLLTGSSNTLLGQQVGYTLTTGSNNLIIGNGSYVDVVAANSANTLNIANMIFGTSVPTSATLGGRIGIGIKAPASELDVNGTITLSTVTTAYASLATGNMWWGGSTFSMGPTPYTSVVDFEVRGSKNVGYTEIRLADSAGTANSFGALYYTGSGQFHLETWAPTGGASFDMSPKPIDTVSGSTLELHRNTSTSGSVATIFYKGDNTNTANHFMQGNGTSYFSVLGYRTGFGTASPQTTVHIHNDVGAVANEILRLTNGDTTTGAAFGYTDAGSTTAYLYNRYAGTTASALAFGFGGTFGSLVALSLTKDLNAVFGGSIATAAPSGGTAGAWKGGIRVAATVALDTTQYIQLDVGGTLYKLAVVS